MKFPELHMELMFGNTIPMGKGDGPPQALPPGPCYGHTYKTAILDDFVDIVVHL